MKYVALWLMCVSSLISGCSSAQYKAIDAESRSGESSNVFFKTGNPKFQIVINKNDRVLSICNISQRCDGLSDINNEVVQISSSGLGLGGHDYADIRCGFGAAKSLGDLDSLYHVERSCDSRFYKTSDIYLGTRILAGLLTVGAYPLFMWNAHKETFDGKAFSEATYNAHLHDFQTQLFSSETKNKSLGSIAVVYVDIDHIDDAYKEIISKPVDADSVVLIDGDTKKPLHVFSFSDFKENELPVAVNLELIDLLSSLAGQSVGKLDAGLDVKRLIPPEVSLPALPPMPQFTKSEYETKADFGERVKSAVSEREDAIRKLQQQYKRDVYNRNQYIVALEESWQQYLDGKATQQNELVRKLRKNQTKLARLLYAMNLGKLTANELSYDAESKSLYFTASSVRYGFKQKMLAKVPASIAESIKAKGNYALTPEFLVQGNNIQMKGVLLAETSSGDNFATNYTDINFKPEFVSVKVAASNIKINKELSAIFKSYEQKPQALVDANANGVGFYIEIRNSINAKIPDWFSTPEQSKNVLSYGVGNSHEEAMLSARRELASTVKTFISSSLDILQINNTFKSLQEITQHTHASTDVELKIGDVSVLHQAEMDGKYYVALCYQCNGKLSANFINQEE